MKFLYLAGFLLIIAVLSLFLTQNHFSNDSLDLPTSDFFIGIDVAYVDVDQTKYLIDQISNYTNFFLLGSVGISHNENMLYELSSYLYENQMYFVVYDEDYRHLGLLNDIQEKYGEFFLGLEFEDEIGGMQLDGHKYRPVEEADNYSDASNQFLNEINQYLTGYSFPFNFLPVDFTLFTADYALYWFDYKAGYDVVLAEFGWNYSRQLNVAMCRGAATIHEKDWGAIITWTYLNPPYLASGEEVFNDLVLAYENGAKYVVILDTNEDYSGSVLQQEHLDALESFWYYIQDNRRGVVSNKNRVAYVLPKDFAYGFRGPNDKIWGLWEADEFAIQISQDLGALLNKYGSKLDVIYNDNLELDDTYYKYIFWNSTIIIP
jgi:hypothetical protein